MFYESIASVYDYIFPQNSQQLAFIEKVAPISGEDLILDVGCATGNLTDLLSSKSNHVIGVDLDSELLAVAKNKAGDRLSFRQMNMLDLDKHFEKNSVDKIVSFGNTLSHLPHRNDVKTYFSSVHSVLKDGGVFMAQIINYDRLIKQNIGGLPTLDNDHIKFVREYIYHSNDGFVEFKTQLTIKSNNQVIENNIPLLTLTGEELVKYLNAAGFINVQLYGDLEANDLKESSMPLLFSAIVS